MIPSSITTPLSVQAPKSERLPPLSVPAITARHPFPSPDTSEAHPLPSAYAIALLKASLVFCWSGATASWLARSHTGARQQVLSPCSSRLSLPQLQSHKGPRYPDDRHQTLRGHRLHRRIPLSTPHRPPALCYLCPEHSPLLPLPDSHSLPLDLSAPSRTSGLRSLSGPACGLTESHSFFVVCSSV